MPEIFIVKSNGDQQIFDEQKLIRSLKKSLATEAEIEKVVGYVSAKLKTGMTTENIYELAHLMLNKIQSKNPNAIRYSIKRSVMDLGPSGFPFELFVARIFVEMGYTCKTGVMVQGHCIEHEVDILAYKDDEVICMEAKFHNESYLKSDIKVALYVKSRFDDLIGQKIQIDGHVKKITKGILLTNTSFTDHAYAYVSCMNTFDLISWNFPKEENLLYYIEKYNLYPITSIPELPKSDTIKLIEKGVLICRDLLEHPEELRRIGIKDKKIASILESVRMICKS